MCSCIASGLSGAGSLRICVYVLQMFLPSDHGYLEWTQANAHRDGQGVASMGALVTLNAGWKVPDAGVLKVNVDAGWLGSGGMGLALVVRDHVEECVYAETCFHENRLDASLAEATALRWAIVRIQALEMETVVVETSALNVVTAFNREGSWAELEPVIKDCRMLFAIIRAFKLQHAKRDANEVAHILASLAIDFPNRCWWEDFPSQIKSVLLADVFSVMN
ncbi:uncharacterized protein LOC130736200 [Lotus japonicus]|uniref:uncharacterized protein LOC130736200 n=1 Tax=Lotus japonicus TaxID=34305 RepID=UPI002588A222|nr:uncharacterized protein LOC130736200 [Lotus japonicus]